MFLLLLLDLVAAVVPSGSFTINDLRAPPAGTVITMKYSFGTDESKVSSCLAALVGGTFDSMCSTTDAGCCFTDGNEPDKVKSVAGYQQVVTSTDATWPEPSGWNPPNGKFCVAGSVSDISTTGWVFKAYEPASDSILEQACDLTKPLNNGGSQVTWTKTESFKDYKTLVLFAKVAAPATTCPVMMTLTTSLSATDTACAGRDADIIAPGYCHGLIEFSSGAWELKSQKVDGSATYLTASRYDTFTCTGPSQFAGCAAPGSPGVCVQTSKTLSSILGDFTFFYNSQATYMGTNCMASVTGLSGATTCTSNAFAITVGLSALITLFLF